MAQPLADGAKHASVRADVSDFLKIKVLIPNGRVASR
jgi:hypothetical protein